MLVTALLFAACGNTTSSPAISGNASSPGASASGPASQPTASDKRIVWASRETIDSAWALETDDAYTLQSMGVGETLARTGFDGLLEPRLATDWKRTGDLTWEFTLKEGVTFHDGTPFDADAVALALTHLLSVEAPARSFNPTTIASVEAIGANIVRVTTKEPNALVPYYVASPSTVILAKKAYAGGQIDPIKTGTGPFVMTATNLPQSATLDRNETYWGGSVGLAGAEVRFVSDGGTRATLVQTGEAQLADNMPIPVIPTLEADPNIAVVRGPLARTNTMYMNNQKAPLSDVRVRQAIQSAIDVDALANSVLEGAVVPAIGPFSPTAAWAPEGAKPIARDLDKAKTLLADAGIQPGSLTLGLWAYPSRPELPDIAVAIQAMLLEAGINVEVRVADYAALEPDVLAGKFDMMLLSRSYLVDINDPIGYLRSDYSCEGTYNLSHFCDEAVDAQLEKALTNDDPEGRYPIYSELATKLQTDAVDVFLYHPQEISAHSQKLQNYRIHPLQHFVLTPELSLSE
jgi:peptide/nickel transport system substrate-binding protein